MGPIPRLLREAAPLTLGGTHKMGAEMPRHAAIHAAPSARDLVLSGLLVSLITAGGLVRLRFGGLDGILASFAGALAGAIFIPVAGAQLAARRLRPCPRRVSPLLLHAVLVPWAAALASAAAILVGSSLMLAERAADLPGANCASFEELLAARWSLASSGEPALVAGLRHGSSVRFNLSAGRPTCQSVSSSARR